VIRWKEKVKPFRYIGSKYKLLSEINNVLKKENVRGNTFFDVFSGSAVVGRYFKNRFSIISNDVLYFSYVLQNGLIVINDIPSFSNLKINKIFLSINSKERIHQILDYLNNLKGIKGFIYNHYTPASKDIDGIERMYFQIPNGMKIDAVRTKIEEWFIDGYINKNEYYYLLTSLLFAVQKVSNVSGKYDSFCKFWDPRAYKPLTLKYVDIIPSKFNHIAYNDDIFNLLDKITCDIAYIDPPYNSRQYITIYHILETIARYDNPKIKGITGTRGNDDKEKSLFCSKRESYNAFSKLIANLKAKYIIVSYNNEGILSKEQINEIFENNKIKEIKLYEIPYRRFKSNNNTDNNKVLEYIFIGTKIF